MKRLATGFVVALVALAFACVAEELLLRSFDVYGVNYYRDVQRYLREAIELAPPDEVGPQGRIFQNKPGVRLELKTFDYETDALRLRTGATAAEQGMAVLFLGDSVTLCWGVEDEDSWVRRLEAAAEASDGRPLRCMNAGHLMFDTVQQASILRGFGPTLEPEVVVLTFVFNDVHPTFDQLQEILDPLASEGDELGWQDTPALRFFWATRSLLRFRGERKRVQTEDKWQFPPYSWYPRGWPRCATALDEVRRTCEQLGARLVINDHTWPAIPELADWCATNSVPRVTTALSEEDQQRYRNSVIDTHLNAEGNAVVADLALAQLIELGILADKD